MKLRKIKTSMIDMPKMMEEVNEEVNTRIENIKSNIDTRIENIKSDIDASILDINSKITSHTENSTIHITNSERNTWNAKAETTLASTSNNGLMSSSDKSKLDNIETGANNYTLPTSSTTVLGGVKVDGRTVTIDDDGVISSKGGATKDSSAPINPELGMMWFDTSSNRLKYWNGSTWIDPLKYV